MPKVTIAVRDIGRHKLDYQIVFDLPEVPKVGDYISVTRPDDAPWTEDYIVRKVWWQLDYPHTGAYATGDERGKLSDIVVIVEQAIGPQSADRWRDGLERQRDNGREVEEFEIPGLGARQDHFKK